MPAVIVWTINDIIGFGFLVIAGILFGAICIMAAVAETINKHKKKHTEDDDNEY